MEPRLLPERERMVLQRLAIFAQGFTLAAASAVAASADISAADVVECVAELVAKSLVMAEVGGPVPCYRLFETTRAYALEKLTDSRELEQVERRYAEYLRELGQRVEVGAELPPASERLAGSGRRIDASPEDWTFSPAGDALIGGAPSDRSVPPREFSTTGMFIASVATGEARRGEQPASLTTDVHWNRVDSVPLRAAVGDR